MENLQDSHNPKGDTIPTEELVARWVKSMDDAVGFIQSVISGEYQPPNSDVVKPYVELLKMVLQKEFIISSSLDKSIYEQTIASAENYLQP